MHAADIPADWGHEEETEIPVEELAKFDEIVDRSFDIERELKEIDRDTVKPLKNELQTLNKTILATLKHHKKTKYSSRAGMVIKAEKFLASFPKELEAKMELIEYMGHESYIEMSGINYNTFNAWIKAKLEQATEDGDLDFKVPGVKEMKFSEYLQRRKG